MGWDIGGGAILFNSNRHRLLHPQHVERVASAIVKWLHFPCDLNNWVTDGVQPVQTVGGGKDFTFNDARAVADGDKLHGLAVLLEVGPADDDEALVPIEDNGRDAFHKAKGARRTDEARLAP